MDNTHQELIVKDKKTLALNGVENILDFSEIEMTIETTFGVVVVEGTDMKIENLSKDDGIVNVVGNIEGFYYKRQSEKKGFFSKILG